MSLLQKSPEKKLRKFRNIGIEEAIKKAARFRRVMDTSGWTDYVELLTDYSKKAQKRKVLTRIDIANEATLAELRLLDHEIWFIEHFIKLIPRMFVDGLDKELKRIKQEEDRNAGNA